MAIASCAGIGTAAVAAPSAEAAPNPPTGNYFLQIQGYNTPQSSTVSGLGSVAHPLPVNVAYSAYSGTFGTNGAANIVSMAIDCGTGSGIVAVAVPTPAPSVTGTAVCDYTAVGTYKVHLYATDNQSGAVQSEIGGGPETVNVAGVPSNLTYTLSQSSATAPANVTITPTLTTDTAHGATPFYYSIDCGNGTSASGYPGTTPLVCGYPSGVGSPFTVKVTGTDSFGQQLTKTTQVTVKPTVPVVVFGNFGQDTNTAREVAVDAQGSTVDQGLRATATVTADWGDGVQTQFPLMSFGRHIYATSGVKHVTLTINDGQQISAPVGKDVTVVDPTQSGPPPSTPQVDRFAGDSRYQTGILTSSKAFPVAGSAGAVVLARGDVFADALAGIPLAKAKNGPLLLTEGGQNATALDPGVAAEIQRVLGQNPSKTVFVLGGAGALSPAIEAYIANTLHYNVVRLAGASRFDTALAIAQDPRALNNPAHVVVARGDDFADALAAGPFAADRDAVNGVPAAIVLSNNATLDPATARYVGSKLSATDSSTVMAIGGGAAAAVKAMPGAVSPTGTLSYRYLYGQSRFDTAARVADVGWSQPVGGVPNSGAISAPAIGLATGYGFPDALTGGAYMALAGGPLLLTDPHDPSGLSAAAAAILARANGYTTTGDVFGGIGVLPRSVSDAMLHRMGITTYAIFGNQAIG